MTPDLRFTIVARNWTLEHHAARQQLLHLLRQRVRMLGPKTLLATQARRVGDVEDRRWLATAHRWLPSPHLATKNLACRSPNSLPLSTRNVECALAQRKLKDTQPQSRAVARI